MATESPQIVHDNALHQLKVIFSEMYHTFIGIPKCIAAASNVCYLANTIADFKLPLRHYKFLTSSWFHASLMQVVNECSSTFNFIQSFFKRESYTTYITEGCFVAVNATTLANACQKLAAQGTDKLEGLIQLIEELTQAISATVFPNQEVLGSLKTCSEILSTVKQPCCNLSESYNILSVKDLCEEAQNSLIISDPSTLFVYSSRQVGIIPDFHIYLNGCLSLLDEMFAITDINALKIKEGDINTMCHQSIQDIYKFLENPKTAEIGFVFHSAEVAGLVKMLVATQEYIKLLAQLGWISTNVTDSRLEPPEGAFLYLKHDRFRAGIHQAVSTGFNLLSITNKNISATERIARFISTTNMEIMDLILFGEPADIKHMLPQKMESAQDTAKKCAKLVSDVLAAFEDMVQLLNEMSVAYRACTMDMQQPTGPPAPEIKVHKLDSVVEHSATPSLNNTGYFVNVLHQGIMVLAEIRAQWTKLSSFFNKLSHIIEMEMYEPFQLFARQITKTAENKISSKIMLSGFAKEQLCDAAQKIWAIALQVRLVCILYVQVSKKHLERPLTLLDEFLATSDATAASQRIQAEIVAVCDIAKMDIESMTTKCMENIGGNFVHEVIRIFNSSNEESQQLAENAQTVN